MPEEINKNQVKSENEKTESTNSKFTIPKVAFQELGGLVKLIPKELSGSEQAILWILVALGIVMLGFALVLSVSNNTIPLLVLFGLGMIFFFIAMIYFLAKRRLAKNRDFDDYLKNLLNKNKVLRDLISQEENKAAKELLEKGCLAWKRDVIALPLPDDVRRRDIVHKLEDIRNAAVSWLNEKHHNLQTNQIRANIFLAKYEEAGKGAVCILRMPEYFRIGMSGHTDEEIAFRPGEGATGKAFVEQKSEVAIFDEKTRTWDERYTLTEYQKRKIHKQLCWIITYPLKNVSGEAMAVLNLDCLRLMVKKGELDRLKEYMQPQIDQIETKLNDYDKVQISIRVERAN